MKIKTEVQPGELVTESAGSNEAAQGSAAQQAGELDMTMLSSIAGGMNKSELIDSIAHRTSLVQNKS